MKKREEIIKHLNYLSAEKYALTKEIERDLRFIKLAGGAINALYAKLGLLDLIEFCNTGRYPE